MKLQAVGLAAAEATVEGKILPRNEGAELGVDWASS